MKTIILKCPDISRFATFIFYIFWCNGKVCDFVDVKICHLWASSCNKCKHCWSMWRYNNSVYSVCSRITKQKPGGWFINKFTKWARLISVNLTYCQLICFKISQINWIKPDLFGKLVLWNRLLESINSMIWGRDYQFVWPMGDKLGLKLIWESFCNSVWWC